MEVTLRNIRRGGLYVLSGEGWSTECDHVLRLLSQLVALRSGVKRHLELLCKLAEVCPMESTTSPYS